MRDIKYGQRYQKSKEESIEERLEKIKTANVQEIWSNIAETCVKVAEEVVRRKKGEKKSEN